MRRLTLGINVPPLFNDAAIPDAVVDARMNDAAGDGVRLARTDALWEFAEPAAPVNGVHAYQWRANDRIASILARHGIRWWAILDYAPAWASGLNRLHGRPRDPADFAAYGRAFLSRYGRGGAFWREHPGLDELPVEDVEVWNEPDSVIFWKPRPDPITYARLYAATRAALHAVDPAVRVWTGGLAHGDRFLREMLDAQPGPVDGIALHAYTTDPNKLVRRVAERVRVAGAGAGPFALTEFGLRTDKPGARDFSSEDGRARYLPEALRALAASGCVQSAFLFAWTTPTPGYGIVPPQGGETPSRRAWAAALDDPPALPAPTVPCS